MAFKLMNAVMTYQTFVNTMLADKLRKTMEVYIDDMIMKDGKGRSYLDDLQDLFTRVAEYKMRLNSAKCMFVVVTKKFFGYRVTHMGIEAGKNQVRAIARMPLPRTNK